MTVRSEQPRPKWRPVLTAIALLIGGLLSIPVQAGAQAPDQERPTPGDIIETPAPQPERDLTGSLATGQPAIQRSAGSGVAEAYLAEDGYVWHGNAGGSQTYPGDGSQNWAYNPTGEDIVVTRTDVGRYLVEFGTTAVSVMPTVTAQAYAASVSNHCVTQDYNSFGNYVDVACYDTSGDPVDMKFSVRWTVTDDDAYLTAYGDGSMYDQYVPPGLDPFTVTRTGAGVYVVTMPDTDVFEGGNTQVNAALTNGYCKLRTWTNPSATVLCFDNDGNPQDSAFSLLRILTNDDAHAWANNSSATTPYAVSAFFSHNPQGVAPTSVKTSTGRYTVEFPELKVAYGGMVKVTAEGNNNIRCVDTNWGTDFVTVACVDPAGNAADSQFDVLYTRFQVCNGLPVNIEIGNNVPTAGNDVIAGTDGDDIIAALDGDDTVCGFGGDDFITGSGGNDTLLGGPGNDTLAGNAGNDDLFGGADNDIIFAGSGDDEVFGEDGEDLLGGSSGFDIVLGGAGNDALTGGSDTDGRVDGEDGNDAVNGGGGDDPDVFGGPGDDTVSGNGGDDEVQGGEGVDEVRGGPGDDLVFGGPGDDFVAGNAGIDTCDGEDGTDTAASNCEVLVNIP